METTTFTNTENVTVGDVLRAQFKFSYKDTETYIVGDNILEKELWTISKKINIGETTMEDIYNCCKRDFQDFQREYIIENVEGNPVIATTYFLYVKQKDESIDDSYSHKRICHIKLEGGIITEDFKYFERENNRKNETFKAPFEVYFSVGLKYHSEIEELFETGYIQSYSDESEDENEETNEDIKQSIKRPIKQTIRADKCCICYENAPNVIYCNCGHIPTCDKCEEKGIIDKCPLCRAEVTIDKRCL